MDLFCELLRGLSARVERRGRAERLDTLADLDAAALRLREAMAVLLDPSVPDEQVRASVFGRVERATLWLRSPSAPPGRPPTITLRPSLALVRRVAQRVYVCPLQIAERQAAALLAFRETVPGPAIDAFVSHD